MREVDVSHARSGGSSLDARDRARDARHGNLRSPSTRDWSGARGALFPRIALAKAYVEGDDARVTHPALLQLRHHSGRDQVDGDAEVGPHPSPTRRHLHQACPTRSDEVGASESDGQTARNQCFRVPTRPLFRRFLIGALYAPCVTTIRARQPSSPWRPARVLARGVCSARSPRRTLPCPRFVPACRAGGGLKYLAPLNVRMSVFGWIETSRARCPAASSTSDIDARARVPTTAPPRRPRSARATSRPPPSPRATPPGASRSSSSSTPAAVGSRTRVGAVSRFRSLARTEKNFIACRRSRSFGPRRRSVARRHV